MKDLEVFCQKCTTKLIVNQNGQMSCPMCGAHYEYKRAKTADVVVPTNDRKYFEDVVAMIEKVLNSPDIDFREFLGQKNVKRFLDIYKDNSKYTTFDNCIEMSQKEMKNFNFSKAIDILTLAQTFCNNESSKLSVLYFNIFLCDAKIIYTFDPNSGKEVPTIYENTKEQDLKKNPYVQKAISYAVSSVNLDIEYKINEILAVQNDIKNSYANYDVFLCCFGDSRNVTVAKQIIELFDEKGIKSYLCTDGASVEKIQSVALINSKVLFFVTHDKTDLESVSVTSIWWRWLYWCDIGKKKKSSLIVCNMLGQGEEDGLPTALKSVELTPAFLVVPKIENLINEFKDKKNYNIDLQNDISKTLSQGQNFANNNSQNEQSIDNFKNIPIENMINEQGVNQHNFDQNSSFGHLHKESEYRSYNENMNRSFVRDRGLARQNFRRNNSFGIRRSDDGTQRRVLVDRQRGFRNENNQIGGVGFSSSKLTQQEQQKITFEAILDTYKNKQVGDIIKYGAYRQTSGGFDMTPIEWIVLSNTGVEMRLLSKYILDCLPFNKTMNSVTWEDCSLRQWLNDEFFNNAFNSLEREQLVHSYNNGNSEYGRTDEQVQNTEDIVFLLNSLEAYSLGDITSLGGNQDDKARWAKGTEYAMQNSLKVATENTKYINNGMWWLRNLGARDRFAISVVDTFGSVSARGIDVDSSNIGVRPAIRISLVV